jgi:iron complex outermembrane receptor protein
MKARALMVGASALAMVWVVPAAAQTVTDSSTSEEAAAPGEIVVTAQRRTEDLSTTPLAATVLSGNDLANKGVVNVDALQFAAPSIVVNNFGQGIDFNVRGIGKGEHNTQTATGVITYRDGAPTFPGYFQQEPYYDVANVQVLRGPQGTIVGQNATGGAIFVNSNDPIINGGVHGYLNLNAGNYNEFGAQGAVNLPVSDTFAVRLSGYETRRDSFYHITGPGGAAYPFNPGKQRHFAGRIGLLWKPTPQLSILSKTDLVYLDLGAYPAQPAGNYYPNAPIGSTTANPNYRDLFNLSLNSPQEARDKFYRSILRVNYEFDGGTQLRSVSSYAAGNTKYRADLDGTSTGTATFFDNVNERQFTQEVSLISPDKARFTYVFGGFGAWNHYNFLPPYQFVSNLSSAPGPADEYRLQGTNPNRSLAVFGQLGFAITPHLKLDAGGRYTASRSINHVQILQYAAPIAAEQKTKSDNFSYKVSLGWQVSRDQFLYGFVATGFKPGGLNVPVGIPAPDHFGEETVTSFEGGWKGQFADRHIRTSITGFYNRYKDFQVIIANPTLPVFGLEINVPGVTKIYGMEAEADAKFGGFDFNVGMNVLNSKIGRFYALDPRGTLSLAACNPGSGPATATCINLTGRDQTYAPNFTFNIGAAYEIPLGTDSTLTPRVNFGHVGQQWATLFENPLRGDRIPDRNILNAQLALSLKKWTVTAYATNLTNQHYPAALNSGLYFAGAPRQYGLKVLTVF